MHCGVGEVHFASICLARNETLPRFVALVDDLRSILLVLCFSTESKLILGFTVRDFVDAEPFVGGTNKARKVTLDIFNVVQLVCKRVVDIDYNDLPVCFSFVEKSHDTQDFHLFDLASVTNLLTNLAHVERVIVALCFGVWVRGRRVFPGLEKHEPNLKKLQLPYLGECTIVPDVTMMGETVANEAQLSLLSVLLDRVQRLLL